LKKEAKTFARWRAFQLIQAIHKEKFFGSFLQKRTASLAP
jgi:hypothetical protein